METFFAGDFDEVSVEVRLVAVGKRRRVRTIIDDILVGADTSGF